MTIIERRCLWPGWRLCRNRTVARWLPSILPGPSTRAPLWCTCKVVASLNPMSDYCILLFAGSLCQRQRCQQLWASRVNEHTHVLSHVTRMPVGIKDNLADDREQTLYRAMPAVQWHSLTSVKCRPKRSLLPTGCVAVCRIVQHNAMHPTWTNFCSVMQHIVVSCSENEATCCAVPTQRVHCQLIQCI